MSTTGEASKSGSNENSATIDGLAIKFVDWTADELAYFTFVNWVEMVKKYLKSDHGQLIGRNSLVGHSYMTKPTHRRMIVMYRTKTAVVIRMGEEYDTTATLV